MPACAARPEFGHPGSELHDRSAPDVGDRRLRHADPLGYFRVPQFIVIVHANDFSMDFRQTRDRRSKCPSQFSLLQSGGRTFLVAACYQRALDRTDIIRIRRFQRLANQGVEHPPALLIQVQRQVQFSGYFFLRRPSLPTLLRYSNRIFHLPGKGSMPARRPIQPAQTVQDRASDFVLGVSSQLNVARWIEAVYRRNQTNDAGGYQVVQAYAFG